VFVDFRLGELLLLVVVVATLSIMGGFLATSDD